MNVAIVLALISLVVLAGCCDLATEPTLTTLPNGNTKYESPLHGGYSFEFTPEFSIMEMENSFLLSNEFMDMVVLEGPEDSALMLMLFSQEAGKDWDIDSTCNETAFRRSWDEENEESEMEIEDMYTKSFANVDSCIVTMSDEEMESTGMEGKLVMAMCKEKLPFMGIYSYKEDQQSGQDALEDLLSTFDC